MPVTVAAEARVRARRKTCQRFDDPGHAHRLTFSCYRRQPFLTTDRGRRWFTDAVRAAV